MKILQSIGSLVFVLGLFVTVFAGLPWLVMVEDDPVIPYWFRAAIFSLLGGILLVLLTLVIEQRKSGAEGSEIYEDKSNHRVLLLNSDKVPDREVTEVLGMVQGHTVFAIWLGKDLSAIARLILGGELVEYTEMMGCARAVATDRMMTSAEDMGADAIINVRYMTTSIIGSASELLVYGTAVKLS
ncbi:MAG: YbjQ family protein [Planctomycetes bacterium]|nr:YbjQ family protein [Planctomycetota bacterium]